VANKPTEKAQGIYASVDRSERGVAGEAVVRLVMGKQQ